MESYGKGPLSRSRGAAVVDVGLCVAVGEVPLNLEDSTRLGSLEKQKKNPLSATPVLSPLRNDITAGASRLSMCPNNLVEQLRKQNCFLLPWSLRRTGSFRVVS